MELRVRSFELNPLLPAFFKKWWAALLFALCSLLLFSPVVSAGEQTEITADNLEYLSPSDTYVAKGSVKIVSEDSTLSADEVRLDNAASEAVAVGNVVYEDAEVIIRADKMELNLKTKLGNLFNSYIYYKKDNFHIRSENVKKTGDTSFYLDKATLTSCNAAVPSWHISGTDIETTRHENLSAHNTKLYIRNTPVFYFPYFWSPLLRERQTGLLFPSFGYSNTRGYYYKQGFFWAFKENQDATLYLDYFSEMKLGEGLDYRYVLSPDSGGEIWIYHTRDNNPARDLSEIKAYHDQKLPYNISAYLKLHAVNEFDYYKTLDATSFKRFGLSSWKTNPFGFASDEELQKYLESNLQLSKPHYAGRTYLLLQTRQSLEGSSREIPQSLPEAGFIINTISKGPFSFNSEIKGVNFWRRNGQDGIRLDIYPNFYFSYGRLVNITQKLGLRETAYFLDAPTVNKSRLLFDLDTALSTKFFKKYSSFVHVIEPSLEYKFIPPHDSDNIPFFDSADSIPHTSSFTYSLTNRISGLKPLKLESRLRLSQSYSLLDSDRPFSPLLAEAMVSSRNIALHMNASYNVHDRRLEETIASVNLRNQAGYIGAGKNFRKASNLDQIIVEAGLNNPVTIYKTSVPVSVESKLWYDLKGHGVQEFNLQSTYSHQCWGITVSFLKRPDEYQISFAFELKGLGTFALGSM